TQAAAPRLDESTLPSDPPSFYPEQSYVAGHLYRRRPHLRLPWACCGRSVRAPAYGLVVGRAILTSAVLRSHLLLLATDGADPHQRLQAARDAKEIDMPTTDRRCWT